MQKQMKYIAAFAIPHALIICFCLFAIALNFATPFISGYAVDSSARLYVGEGKRIYIYQDGEEKGFIELRSSNYEFTVGSDDHILVAYPSRVCLMDISGNILQTTEDPNAQTYSQIQNNGRTIVLENGDTYKMAGTLGWTRIVKNNTVVVYRISVLSFIIKCLIWLCAISMFVNGVWVVHHVHKLRGQDNLRH